MLNNEKGDIVKKIIVIAIVVIPLWLFGQIWQRVLEESIDDNYLAGAYSGGVNYSKPYWIDIDADNDFDLFIGEAGGGLHFYRNDGTVSSPSWAFVEEHFENIDVGNRSSQAFVDIDADGDYDLFIGEQWGMLYYYRNEGTPNVDSFVFVTDNYEGIDVGGYSAPFFCDIDNDGDSDLFIGEHAGNINYYRNDGTPSSPSWTLVDETWFGIDVGTKNIPWFIDIDADGDLDLFIGYSEGTTYFYRNDGTPSVPNMVYVTDNYISDVGNTNAPSFVDIDNDGDYDFFVGEFIGNTNFYRNTGTPSNASWSFIRRHYLTIDMNSSTTPVLVDIDADGDYDLFSGEWVGFIDYFKNTGTPTNPKWDIISENYLGIDVGDNSTPDFVDIDNDNDYDMFIGNVTGNIYYYRNDGSAASPSFTFVSSNYNSIDVGDNSAPAFIDIDNDNDFDLFIGNLLGTIWYYRNDGTASVPSWTYITDTYESIDIGERSNPTFADIDNDNDYDLFIGEALGTTFHYRNDGTSSSPSFTFVTDAFADINVGENTAPAFIDINNDGDLDLFIGERWGGLNHYEQITGDLVPPEAPYIYGEKAGNDAYFWWHPVTTDTAGNPENVSHYVIYRNTVPSFVPGPADSIGSTLAPDTIFLDIGALNTGISYYYLVKTVDVADNRSTKSNMGYKFDKYVNENPGVTSDRNWTSLPWHSEYTTVSDLTIDLSPSGNPLIEINNLRDDQLYENYTYIPGFGWLGTDFLISSGRGYELVTNTDTDVILVGSNDPDGLVNLNENSGAVSDRNWTSIPYNAIYNTVSGITTEYSPSGNPLIEINNLRDDQLYENYTYIPGFGWLGTDFSISPGRGYELVVNTDATWNPTEYSNQADYGVLITQRKKKTNMDIHLGTLTKPIRFPAWVIEDYYAHRSNSESGKKTKFDHPERYRPATGTSKQENDYRKPGISHIVFVYLNMQDFESLVFTAYRVEQPHDVLTNDVIGCGTVRKGTRGALWFNTGNFKHPWHDGEEMILLIEASKKNKAYFCILNFTLDKGVDIQNLGEASLCPVPEPETKRTSCVVYWDEITDANVIGYSLFQDDKRLNDKIIPGSEYTAVTGDICLKPVIRGGYETVYGSQQSYSTLNNRTPVAYALTVYPNPFSGKSSIDYALPHLATVNIRVYDISGRHVKTLINEKLDAGYYKTNWFGDDDAGKKVTAGVYFIQLTTQAFGSHRKIIVIN